MSKADKILLIEDTREPEGGGYSSLFKSPCIRAALATADYSLCGAEAQVAIERKTASDLVSSLIHNRERFEKEMNRLRLIPHSFVVVEADASAILQGQFGRSKVNPCSVWETVCAWTIRYGVPFLFASDRTTAARLTESLLLKWYREHTKILDECRKASRKLKVR